MKTVDDLIRVLAEVGITTRMYSTSDEYPGVIDWVVNGKGQLVWRGAGPLGDWFKSEMKRLDAEVKPE